jgi:predicted transposase YbfD/YdcC
VLVDVELDDVGVSGPGGLLERPETLSDPRSRHGRRHALAGVSAIAAAAVLGGARSYAAIAEFAWEVPQQTLARLGMWQRPYFTWWVAPSETTLRRVVQQVDADELDRVVGCWLATQQPSWAPAPDDGTDGAWQAAPGAVAVDGKTLRGAVDADGRQVHLLAALAHGSGTVLAQRRVDAKTNEITGFRPLLDEVDLEGKVVTADALRTQTKHARYLVGDRQADYLFCVKGNQPTLEAAISRVPPAAFPPVHQTVDRGHGRIEQRTIHTAPMPAGLRFPHAKQVLVIQRHTTDLAGGHPRTKVCYAITSLDPTRADPARLGVLARGQWQIENRAHWVRDVLFDEDRSQVRTGHGPQVMATLRNLAISLLRLGGHDNIARGLRWAGRDRTGTRAFVLLGV